MHLKQLEVHGFKTFANRTGFGFNLGITAIVGPNGSGKSNVADAIRWALGEQSSSILRSKKTEDLIFSGSHVRPRLGMAEVAITLENPFSLGGLETTEIPAPRNGDEAGESRVRANIVDEILKAHPTEVTLLRRAYRSGENEYLINRQRVRLKDIQDLLQHWGLARNTYAVIGQGLVDAALALRPEERRGLFEEAAGIGLYQSKKQNALEKLEETQVNLVRVNDIINEIAPRLPSLARQADRAQRYDSVASALSSKLRQWYSFQWARAQEHHSRSFVAEEKARAELSSQRNLVADVSRQLTEARREAQRLRTRMTEYRRARTQKETEYTRFERDLAVLTERIGFSQQQTEEAKEQAASLQSRAQSAKTKIDDSVAQRVALENERARVIARKRLAESRVLELGTAFTTQSIQAVGVDGHDLYHSLANFAENLHLYESTLPRIAGLASQAQAHLLGEITFQHYAELRESSNLEANEAKTALALVERDIQAARLAEETARSEQSRLEQQIEEKHARSAKLVEQANSLYEQERALRANADTLTGQIRQLSQEAFPDEGKLAASEQLQSECEDQEALARNQLTTLEESFSQAVLDAERSRAEIARLEGEIEDDLGAVELNPESPHQLRLRLVYNKATVPSTAEETESAPEEQTEEIVVLPDVISLPDNFEKEIRRLKNQMKYIGNVNPSAPQEYVELKKRHAFLTEQASDLAQAISRLHQASDELDEIMKQRFKETFDAINTEFKKYFSILFGGGTARLELTEPDDLIHTGIEIIARPPGKRATHLAMLSGGERSLTATSLVFAILKASPTPFCVLDEVDAMLDEGNVGRFRDALRELSGQTQFIVITHNRATIESASTVYGISMGEDGVSQVISMRLAESDPTDAAERHAV